MKKKECKKCKRLLSVTKFRKNKLSKDGLISWCRDCLLANNRKWKKAHPERYKELCRNYRIKHRIQINKNSRRWRNKHPERIKEFYNNWYKINQEKYKADRKTKYEKIRKEVLDLYDGKCTCCGETEIKFLSFDHTNNDGKHDRKHVGTGLKWLRHLLKNKPSDIQILCHNCNQAKGHYGMCPHQIP